MKKAITKMDEEKKERGLKMNEFIKRALEEKMGSKRIEISDLPKEVAKDMNESNLFRGTIEENGIKIEMYLDCDEEREIFVEYRYGKPEVAWVGKDDAGKRVFVD